MNTIIILVPVYIFYMIVEQERKFDNAYTGQTPKTSF